MTNRQHLAVLQQSIDIWNLWRKEHKEVRPNLSEADLRGANLSEANLSEADLRGVDLSEANLRGANLSEANLSDANLRRADFSLADLSQANLSEARLRGANLSYAKLAGADLRGAGLSEATLIEANLRGANLSKTDLIEANLSRANLSRANLSRANLSRANLIGTDLSVANFTQIKLGWTIFGNVDLQLVEGLETIHHSGPSTIGIDTLERSKGNIPEAFLRGAGVSDTFIAYARSLFSNPIEYYTCFISYSRQDQELAERLHTDLQSKGVRCWFAPEDLKIGDRFRQRIDESIHLYDKLLLVLSKHSVASQWVEKEVEAALEKEYRQKKLVLFPIKSDEAVTEASQTWAVDIRRMRHIGDFRRWKHHNDYQKALVRLLRDLQPEKY